MQGRGRAAGLSCHTDPLPVPGDLANIGVTNLTIREQINRVRGDLPIYETPIDYSQYILPRRPSLDDEEGIEPERPASQLPPPRQVMSQLKPAQSRRGGWTGLDPGGEVAAVESSLLPQNMSGGGDAGVERCNQSLDDSNDVDVLEERTSSSDTSGEWRAPRTYRPRPPALDKQSFPPLPEAAPSPAGSPSRPGRPSPSRRAMAAGGDGPAAHSKKRGGRQGRKKPTAADSPAGTPTVTSSASSAAGQMLGAAPVPEDRSIGRVYVTGVTDDNWEKVRSYVTQYGTVEDSERGSAGDGWFALSPAESAEWMVSVHTSTECDIAGVAFQLADDSTGRHWAAAERHTLMAEDVRARLYVVGYSRVPAVL